MLQRNIVKEIFNVTKGDPYSEVSLCRNYVIFSQTFIVGSESFHLYLDRNEAVVVSEARCTEARVVTVLLHTRSSVLTRVTATWEQVYPAVLTL